MDMPLLFKLSFPCTINAGSSFKKNLFEVRKFSKQNNVDF